MKKIVMFSAVVMLLLAAVGQSVWAFSDTRGNPHEAKIAELKKLGILAASKEDKFKPGDKLTYAEGITLIVKGLGLNIDDTHFIKEPKASDYFTNMKDDAWYSNAFNIAYLNGLDIPKDVNPSASLTREQFAHYLFRSMMTKGVFAFIEIFILINDEADVSPVYMESIQKLLIIKIAQLDNKQNFNPKAVMTRGEAAGWLYDGIQFVKDHALKPEPGNEPFPLYELSAATEAVNDEVNKITITAQAPNPGYGLRIASITFTDNEAHILVEPIYPNKDMMYPQVITKIQTTTYIAKNYKPVLVEGHSPAQSPDEPQADSTSSN